MLTSDCNCTPHMLISAPFSISIFTIMVITQSNCKRLASNGSLCLPEQQPFLGKTEEGKENWQIKGLQSRSQKKFVPLGGLRRGRGLNLRLQLELQIADILYVRAHNCLVPTCWTRKLVNTCQGGGCVIDSQCILTYSETPSFKEDYFSVRQASIFVNDIDCMQMDAATIIMTPPTP